MRKTAQSLFTLLAVFSIIAITPSAFADHLTAEVDIAVGSQFVGCETTNECYISHMVTLDVGGEVMWNNIDSAGHTVTSGTPAEGPSGHFDSGLMAPDAMFSHKFTGAGTYDYFCIVHSWMTGSVMVSGEEEHMEGDSEMGGMEMDHEMKSMGEYQVSAISSDGSLMVNVDTSDPMAGEMMSVKVTITTDKKVHQMNANYDIIITQDGKTVLSEAGVYTTHGEGEHMTDVLESSNPVDVQVTLQGIGKPGEPKTGAMGEAISFHVVPEFGTIAMIILAVAIVSIIAITAKTKTALIPKL